MRWPDRAAGWAANPDPLIHPAWLSGTWERGIYISSGIYLIGFSEPTVSRIVYQSGSVEKNFDAPTSLEIVRITEDGQLRFVTSQNQADLHTTVYKLA